LASSTSARRTSSRADPASKRACASSMPLGDVDAFGRDAHALIRHERA
jgi:hypothetical protein